MPENKDQPLRCSIENDQLVIRIGIDVLAHSAENCPRFYDEYYCQDQPYVKVINKQELATDIALAIQHEQEDGSSPISNLLDDAFEFARDDGSLAFEDVE